MAVFGPVQLFLIGLDNEKMQGQVSRELHRASEKGNIRVLDALAIQKTKDGAIITLSGSDLTPEQRMEYGAIVGALLGYGATGTEEGLDAGAELGAETFASHNFGLSASDVQAIAEDVPEGTTAVIVLMEHLWALPLKEAVEQAGGVVLAQGMVRPETLMALGAYRAAASVPAPSTESSSGAQIQ
ncbi:MAG TPA: DUF1269 domain-containing protein [Ktedonobacterales bacterium]|nr:DUF1269 domain-containing protein [Ktedonobacterales bacterium]